MTPTSSLRKLAEKNIHVFLKLYGIKTENGMPLDLRSHHYLVEPFNDFSPKQCVLKSAQCGWSTLSIIKAIWLAKTLGLQIAYTLPSASDAATFVRSKVDRVIRENPILHSYVKEGNTLSEKSVGKSVIFFRGTFTEQQAISFTSDLNIHDEIDRSDQSIIATYSSRLQHSAYKWTWVFSNPSVQGAGSSRFWPISDQKHYFIKCGRGHKQYLKWPESICPERRIFQCRVCHEPLTNEQRRVGNWVKKVNEAEYSGYWVSQMMCPWVSAEDILRDFEMKPRDFFWNFVLGLPYIGENNTVTQDMIYRNCEPDINDQEDVVIGCDSGLTKHYVLGNAKGIFFYGKTDTWDTIRALLAKYKRSVAVIDALPDLTEPRKLREEFPGRVFLAHYVKDRKTMSLIRWGQKEEEGNVNIDRNRMMQHLIDEFADGRIPLQGNRDDWSEYYEHWSTLYRIEEKDGVGNPFFVWETSNGKDHWCHATLYWRVGMSKFGQQKATIINPTLNLDFQSSPRTVFEMKAPDIAKLAGIRSWQLE